MGTEDVLRLTVKVIMQVTGEQHVHLAEVLGVAPAQVGRRQNGTAHWSLADCDRLAAHWGLSVPDLLTGPAHALNQLPAAQQAAVGAPELPCQPTVSRRSAPPETSGAPEPQTTAPDAHRPAAPRRRQGPPYQPLTPIPTGWARPGQAAAEPAASSSAPQTARAVEEPARPPRRPAPAGPLPDLVRAAVARTLAEHQGDIYAARAALLKRAIPDVMALFEASRVGGRYEHSQFPPTTDLLRKASQKGADQVWEGRPKWRASELHRAAREGLVHLEVTALDMNAAYLAALKTHLPIGKLVHSTGDEAALDPKRAGIHRVTPAEWTAEDLPSPLGARKEPGDLWVSEPTLRLLLHCARLGLCEAPAIHESWTSGSSEGLLEKMRRALVEVRKEALANDDEVTTEYVKSMYSKFVSTIGESSANREIRRPDWMHIIRSQAFANLWRKAYKAHEAGLTVVEMSGTDELHLAGDWRQVFTEGRDLAQVKPKHTYILGGDQ